MKACLACCSLVASLGAMADDSPAIGRLFAPAAGSSISTAASRLRVDGAVARSSGKNTVWINGQPYTEKNSAGPGARTGLGQMPTVRLEGGYAVRIGDTLDREARLHRGLLPENAVARGR